MGKEWQTKLTLLSACENEQLFHETVDPAIEYLTRHGLEAQCIAPKEKVAQAILQTVNEQNCDLIMMGGFGAHPAVGLVLGSSVDNVLQETQVPVLICR